jgi:hypothetical protein
MTTSDLLIDLGSNTDLTYLVQRLSEYRLPRVVVYRDAVTGWGRRDPEGWRKVSAWLAEQGVAFVRI